MRKLNRSVLGALVGVGALTGACTSQTVIGMQTTGSGGAAGMTGGGPGSGPGATGAGGGAQLAAVTKIDLLFSIDNSRSMADKQLILAAAVPDFVSSLVNPSCLDPGGSAVAGQPAGPLLPCPAGSKREFVPILDIHIGIVTSSLGGQGADSCPNVDTSPSSGCPNVAHAMGVNLTENDHGRLVARQDPCSGQAIDTYKGEGFLNWDPAQTQTPPGDKDLGDLMGTPGIVPALHDMILGVGQIGCGFEQQNEAWYRFLVDPTPYESIAAQIVMVGNPPQGITEAVPAGIDQTLLAERADFLRPDSMLAIVVLTDENDNSIKDSGQYFLVAQNSGPSADGRTHLPPGTKICETNPSDPCCINCDQAVPPGCPPSPSDPNCSAGNRAAFAKNDPINLRETNVKRRFGIEFYQQPDRYITGLTAASVPDVNGNVVANPIYSVLVPGQAAAIRDPGLVFLEEIVGVPWQDLARQDANGTPDLVHGLDANGLAVGGFKSAEELARKNASGIRVWDGLVGDWQNDGLAANPLMIESVYPRTPGADTGVGSKVPNVTTDPITGQSLKLVSDPTCFANPTDPSCPPNGHEWLDTARADLQYACIFDLPAPRHCSTTGSGSCDCEAVPANGVASNSPLCAYDPIDPNPNNRSLQVRAKAYPGIKDLAIAEGLGSQGVVASICTRQITDPTRADYGYRPALRALIEAMSKRLPKP